MLNVMFDLETMGRSSKAAIIQIGACTFDIETAEISRRMTVNVELASSMDYGLEVDPATIRFWMEQPAESRTWMHDAAGGHGFGMCSLPKALKIFSDFIRGERLPLWSHESFDVPIISSAYRACELEIPFWYQDVRSLRTLIELAGYKRPSHDGIPHDALSDCEYQARYCVEAMKLLKGNRPNVLVGGEALNG